MAKGKRGVILISLDEVRPDHLSCYGYERIRTENMDRSAAEGVLFETSIAASCYTGICMASMITGVYPNKHTLRDPFGRVQAPTAGAIFKKQGYATAAFVGNGVLGEKHGFAAGFDHFREPGPETAFNVWKLDEREEPFHIGYWWVDDMLNWLDENHKEPFFIWGHLFHTHRGGEVTMLEQGMIKEGVLPELFYMDAKIKAVDELLFGALAEKMRKLGIEDECTLVITSDHGTNTGEHPPTEFDYVIYPDDPVRDAEARKQYFPQHLNLFDVNVKTVLIVKDPDLPRGARVSGMVRSVDLLPTLMELHGIPDEGLDLDGESWVSAAREGRVQGRTAYLESLHEWESEKDALVQGVRTDEIKLIRNLADTSEQFYDLIADPGEQNNIIDQVRESRREELLAHRKIMNEKILTWKTGRDRLSARDRSEIENRLRQLGYMR